MLGHKPLVNAFRRVALFEPHTAVFLEPLFDLGFPGIAGP
jgi:hypothetical protein